MPRLPSRSSSLAPEAELRLPRTPGIIRRFWARHPVFADVLIAVICLFLSAAPATVFRTTTGSTGVTVYETSLITAHATLTALIVLACALLLLRRRQWPVVTTIAAYAVSLASLFTQVPAGSGPLLLTTGYALAVYRSTRAAWMAYAVGTAVLALVAWALTGSLLDIQSAVNGVAGAVVLALIGTLVGANVGARKRYLEALIDRSRQLLVERDQQAQLAASAERARIAREMHDIVSHSLTVIVALSEGAAATADPVRAKDASTAAAATARSALTEMRAMLGVLREGEADAPLAPIEPVPPGESVLAAQRAGFPAVLTTRGEAASPAAVEYAIGRIVQEGLTNAMRHAPGATRIAVLVERRPDHAVVEVRNDGVASVLSAGGFGLRGLAERAAHVGGTVRSGADGEDRWLLSAHLPVRPVDSPASTAREETA